jgi:hypothetical protein
MPPVDLKTLETCGYTLFTNFERYQGFFNHTFDLIEKEWENPTPKITRSWLDGWTFTDGPFLRNVLYVNKIDKKSVEDIKSLLIDSKIKSELERLLKYNIGVCNIRAYRYTHNPPDEKTHFDDVLDYGGNFNPHLDDFGLPVIKVMIYRSADSNCLTEHHGVTKIKTNSGWISPILGKKITGFIFTPHVLLHYAENPVEGKIRDCIEITIIRRNNSNFLVTSAGAMAGRPENLALWDSMA